MYLVVLSMGVTYTAVYLLPFEERFGLTKHDIALRLAGVQGLFAYVIHIIKELYLAWF